MSVHLKYISGREYLERVPGVDSAFLKQLSEECSRHELRTAAYLATRLHDMFFDIDV